VEEVVTYTAPAGTVEGARVNLYPVIARPGWQLGGTASTFYRPGRRGRDTKYIASSVMFGVPKTTRYPQCIEQRIRPRTELGLPRPHLLVLLRVVDPSGCLGRRYRLVRTRGHEHQTLAPRTALAATLQLTTLDAHADKVWLENDSTTVKQLTVTSGYPNKESCVFKTSMKADNDGGVVAFGFSALRRYKPSVQPQVATPGATLGMTVQSKSSAPAASGATNTCVTVQGRESGDKKLRGRTVEAPARG
jgi:hypothetical protein